MLRQRIGDIDSPRLKKSLPTLLLVPLTLGGCDGNSNLGCGPAFAAFFDIIIRAFYLEIMGHLLIVTSIVLTILTVATALRFFRKSHNDQNQNAPPKESDPH